MIPPRNKNIEDESIWSFITRRLDSNVADNIVDPVLKGSSAKCFRKITFKKIIEARIDDLYYFLRSLWWRY